MYGEVHLMYLSHLLNCNLVCSSWEINLTTKLISCESFLHTCSCKWGMQMKEWENEIMIGNSRWTTNLITRSISKLLSPKDTALFHSIYSFCSLKFKFIWFHFKLHSELFNLSVNWNRLIFCFLIAVIELVVLCLTKRCVSLCTDRWACNHWS